MKDMGILSTVNVLIIVIYPLMLGCQNDKVSHFNFPDDFQVVKSIETELFSSETNGVRETKTGNVDAYSIPDYFDYKRAVEAYEEGRLKATQVPMPHVSTALMVFEETNLVAQAYRDRYTPIQYNCQDYADDLRLEYDRLMKDPCERKKCGLK